MKSFIYKNSLKWQGQKKGLLTSLDRPDLEIATPAEFQGHAGFWGPEDLFVAAVNSCIMTTFLHYAQREKIKLLDYTSNAQGVLEMSEGRLQFVEIRVNPEIIIGFEGDYSDDYRKVKGIIDKAERACLISNSIKSKISVSANILFKK